MGVFLDAVRQWQLYTLEEACLEKLAVLSQHSTKMLCAWCYIDDTPMWRREPRGKKKICNACWACYRRHPIPFFRFGTVKILRVTNNYFRS